MTDEWLADKTNISLIDTSGWTTHHWNFFLRRISPSIALNDIASLDSMFNLTASQNAEIACDWLLLCIKAQYSAAYPALEQFLINVGRRKFLKPLYTNMANNPATLILARDIYKKARPGYHSVSARTIDEILNWNQ